MTYYMAITKDKYELPLAVGDSMKELAEMLGISPDAIWIAIKRTAKDGKQRGFCKVVIQNEV